MKLLEEDEDESMHSGADVDAFTAALNRDIEGAGASCSQPPHSDSSALSQENNQTATHMYSQWQPSNQDENKINQCQQQELTNQEQREQQSSKLEVKEHVSGAEVQRDVNGSQVPSGLPMHYNPMQVDSKGRQAEQNSGEFSQSSAEMQLQMSGTGQTQICEPERMLNSGRESQFSNMQRFSNQPVPGPEPPGNSANRAKQIPFGSLLPIILPELDKDRAMQLQTLYGKLRRNEIPKDGFVRLMRSIVGDQMLRLAVVKMQAKGNKNPETVPNQFQARPQNPMQQQQQQHQHLRPPAGTAAQFSDPYSFGQLHHKGQSAPAMAVTSRPPASVMQAQKDSSHKIVDSSAFKSREVEHLTYCHGTQANQMSDRSAMSIQGLTKQQLQHLHFSQSSFPMYGASGYNPYPGTNVSTSSTMVRPQPLDPQMRQVQLHQGFGATNADGTSQAMTGMNVPKVERQNSFSDPRVLGTTVPNMSSTSMPHNSVAWQPVVGKEQNIGALPSMGYVKQEPVDHSHEKQPKPPSFSSQGPAFSGAGQAEQGKAVTGASNDEVLDRQNPGVAFPSSTRTSTTATPGAVTSHLTPSSDADFQSTSASPMSGTGVNTKASAKKPSGIQKRPLDSHASSPPLPSKKQKVSGALADQSIEHLNDVTAVSGVNLREEEEQLFSGSKDDSRVSEASRRAVQEEEDRLILQKTPLQKKLAEIMTKNGLKNLGNDVERCLSLCVEERLRGLISSLIRVSKQRVDSEKSRHNTVVTSDVREQILAINRKAREEWEKKQAEAEKLRRNNDPNNSTGVDGEKEKEEGRGKPVKSNKEEDDKMRTTAANVAARAAVGGDDMLSKWQLMAQARQKREGGPETAPVSQTSKDAHNKVSATSAGNAKDVRAAGKKDQPNGISASGAVRQSGRSQVTAPPPRAAHNISIKDVIVVLEREPQMAKSTVIYRLYEKMRAEAATE